MRRGFSAEFKQYGGKIGSRRLREGREEGRKEGGEKEAFPSLLSIRSLVVSLRKAAMLPEKEPGARPKQRGGRVVPSRYMEYEKKAAAKPASASTHSVSRGHEPKSRAAAAETSREVLHSTLLESSGRSRPDLDFSAIKAKTAVPKASGKGAAKKRQSLASATEDQIAMLDSQTLLLTFCSVKMERSLARLEKEGEKNLLLLAEEAEKLQEEAHRKRLLLERMKHEQKLGKALETQLGALEPVAEQCLRFTEQYQDFATAVDSTRHQLPLKEVHLGEDKGQYVADLQRELAATQEVLSGALREDSERNTKALRAAKALEEASLQVDAELPRTFAEVVDLSADASKEASLQQQKAAEETLGLEATKRLYFN